MSETKPARDGTPATSAPLRAKLQIIHRNRMFRECLFALLSRDARFEVVENHFDATGAIGEEVGISSDVILVDAGLPSRRAVDLIQWVRKQNTTTKLLAVVSAASQDIVSECIAAGAHGCVLEESSLDDLLTGIVAVQAGETFCSQEMMQVVFSQFAQIARESQLQKRVRSVDLTPRELQILELISSHLSNKQIAKRLSVSLYTVKNHVHNILEKLELTSRFEAVDYARQKQWIAHLAAEKHGSQQADSRLRKIR